MKIKTTSGLFSSSVEIDYEELRDNPWNHYGGKNDGCLFCSSFRAPKCPYHDTSTRANK